MAHFPSELLYVLIILTAVEAVSTGENQYMNGPMNKLYDSVRTIYIKHVCVSV